MDSFVLFECDSDGRSKVYRYDYYTPNISRRTTSERAVSLFVLMKCRRDKVRWVVPGELYENSSKAHKLCARRERLQWIVGTINHLRYNITVEPFSSPDGYKTRRGFLYGF